MTREAAVLGVPSGSFFMGREGMVDEHLASLGRLVRIRTVESAAGFDPSAIRQDSRMDPDSDLPGNVADLLLNG